MREPAGPTRTAGDNGRTTMTKDIRTQAGRDRFVILHFHIFKNAGSTLEHILARNFGDDLVAFHGAHDDARLWAEDVLRLLDDHAGIRAITSHHLRYPKPARRDVVVHDICFIRHPLARIRSLYFYGRKLDPAHWLGALAQRHDEKAFVAHLLEVSPDSVSDVQVHFLAQGAAFARPCNHEDLRLAEAIVRDAAVAGVVEMFDESLAAAEYFLRPAFPGIDFAYAPKNVSSPHPLAHSRTTEELSLSCRQAWGDRLYEAVERLNGFDMALYQAARSEVARRFSMVPDAGRKLEDLRVRCARQRSDADASGQAA